MRAADRFVVRWWGRAPRSGPHCWYFGRRRQAITAARRVRWDYEVIDRQTGTVVEFAVLEG